MPSRIRRYRSTAFRAFLAFCVAYTLFTLLFNYRSTRYIGISESACQPLYVGPVAEADLPQALVETFAPTLVFSFREPADLRDEVVVPYQIVPDIDETGRYVWRGVVAFRLDYGASSFGIRFRLGGAEHSLQPSSTLLRVLGWIYGTAHLDSHVGDIETFEIYLKRSAPEGYWEIDALRTFPHGSPHSYTADQIHCFRDSPILYVSRGKHALYPSLDECNSASVVKGPGVRLVAEDCSVGELYYPSTSPEFNVGDSRNPINIFATSPTLRRQGVFVGEDAWGSCFYGGYGPNKTPHKCRVGFHWW